VSGNEMGVRPAATARGWQTRRVVLGLVLIMAVGGAVWQVYDESRLRSIVVGMAEGGVSSRLGAPPNVIPGQYMSRGSAEKCDARQVVDRWVLYPRALRPGLLVGIDQSGRVVCVVRTRLRIVS